jgi:hypothetical protein
MKPRDLVSIAVAIVALAAAFILHDVPALLVSRVPQAPEEIALFVALWAGAVAITGFTVLVVLAGFTVLVRTLRRRVAP